jgi:hypothetical protein
MKKVLTFYVCAVCLATAEKKTEPAPVLPLPAITGSKVI